jgi:ABC-type sugar transport system ATPase subunit
MTTIYVTHDQSEAMALADRVAVMNDGRLLQLGPPLEVYRRPRTTFVAGFIGSPPMNVLRARWADGVAHLDGGGGACIDPAAKRERVEAAFQAGARLWVGVRPEHVHLAPDGKSGLEAGVEGVEPLGSETLIRVRVGDQELVLRRFGDDDGGIAIGSTMPIELDGGRTLWYTEDGELVV